MAHFAQVDDNNVVLQVIVIEQEELNKGHWGDPAKWIQTSYNNNIRGRFAGVGFTYDPVVDEFIPPSPGDGWTWNGETGRWEEDAPQS